MKRVGLILIICFLGCSINSGAAQEATIARGQTLLLALDLLREARARQLVHAEGGVELAQHVVGRHVAVLERLEIGDDLRGDEAAHRVADHLVLLAPFDHGEDSCVVGPGDRRSAQCSEAGRGLRPGARRSAAPAG